MEDFNVVDPAYYAAHGYPHELWTRLRREDPVHWWDKTEGLPFWAITKQSDIIRISTQPERFQNGPRLVMSPQPEPPPEENQFPPTLIQLDPPKHRIYRKLVS